MENLPSVGRLLWHNLNTIQSIWVTVWSFGSKINACSCISMISSESWEFSLQIGVESTGSGHVQCLIQGGGWIPIYSSTFASDIWITCQYPKHLIVYVDLAHQNTHLNLPRWNFCWDAWWGGIASLYVLSCLLIMSSVQWTMCQYLSWRLRSSHRVMDRASLPRCYWAAGVWPLDFLDYL